VGEVAAGCSPATTISPDAEVAEAMAAMDRARVSRLMVVEGERLVGITLKDLLHFFSVQMEVEGQDGRPFRRAASLPA
jgi:signal-transduction protein with cAMP-binding, CBS, and nucleotidyltransferase domain